jgi:hypothetical protein
MFKMGWQNTPLPDRLFGSCKKKCAWEKIRGGGEDPGNDTHVISTPAINLFQKRQKMLRTLWFLSPREANSSQQSLSMCVKIGSKYPNEGGVWPQVLQDRHFIYHQILYYVRVPWTCLAGSGSEAKQKLAYDKLFWCADEYYEYMEINVC